MALYQNLVLLLGYAGSDPETHTFDGGGTVTNISLATTRYWKKKGSEDWSEETTWHRLVFYNRDAEKVVREVKKGSRLQVQGYIRSRTVTGDDGSKKYYTDIVVDKWINLDPKEKTYDQDPGYQGHSQSQEEPEEAATTDPLKPLDDPDDDLPF